ncbi:MAG: FAD-binding and (Fe-S)-binding domain-containing protein [Anaerolineales bacterium]
MVDSRAQTQLRELLEQRLRGEVRFDPYARSLYSTDASNHQITPLGVVLPETEEDLFSVVETAAELDIPLLPRGGGTSLSGASVGEALIVDCSKHLAHIHHIDPESRMAEVGPGVVCNQLNAAAAKLDLMYGPDPASADRATFGGMIGTNATGAHSIRYGMTADHVLAVDAVLADGSAARFEEMTLEAAEEKAGNTGREAEIYAAALAVKGKYAKVVVDHWPRTWRRSSGYSLNYLTQYTPDRPAAWYQEEYPPKSELNLAPLLCGSEGTLAILRRAEVRLVPRPQYTTLVVLEFDSVVQACDYTPSILETEPAVVELIPRTLIKRARAVPAYSRRLGFVDGDPPALLVVEYTGNTPSEAQAAAQELGRRGRILADSAEQADLWAVRKAGLGLLMSVPGDAKPITFMEDVAVPVEQLSCYVKEADRLLQESGTHGEWYAHASAGCLHMRPLVNLKTAEGVQQMRTIADAVVDLATSMRGSISGEHGDGLSHTEYNERLFGTELMQAFGEIKQAFDPAGILNPGKVVEPMEGGARIDTNLRYGPSYATLEPETVFAFRKESGFARAVEACTGVGICRKADGVMCPSFQATLDETHSTRGRANALRAAISGRLPADAMSSREIYEILDLCIECKGCKSECPAQVDMARLKAEFLGQYQAVHGVPLRSRLFGEIATSFNVLQPMAPLVNIVARMGIFRWLLGQVVHIAPQRTLPELAARRFSGWFGRSTKAKAGKQVVLFLDTYTEFNNPEIGEAAVELLDAAGYKVTLVPGQICCGRPLISKGMLGRAKANAMRNVRALAPYAREGEKIVGLEPSCVSALRDEYPDLLPHDQAAIDVAEAAILIEEFFVEENLLEGLDFKVGEEPIVLHNHCHTKSLIGSQATLKMLHATGRAVEEIPSGCCGMAGSFGYEAEHYDISMQIGELGLLPAVRRAVDTQGKVHIVAPGMSCRAQIRDGTAVKAQHPVQLLAELLAVE